MNWTKNAVPGEPGLALWRFSEATARATAGATGEPSGERESERNGPPILCLHGITAQHRSFNALARHLDENHELFALDLRGRGDSEKPDSGYGLSSHARDVGRTLDRLDLERAVLCGHSMGAFVAVKTALQYPERVAALVLLDGGWPRVEASAEDQRALEEGLARAFSRLDMTFESPEAYLDFWFPGQGLAPEDLPPDLADYYLYDLEETEGGYSPKASYAAAEEDAASLAADSPDASEMEGVSCPVMLARAWEGFFPGSEPLLGDEARDEMLRVLDIRAEVFLEANHYTMMFDSNAKTLAGEIRDYLDSVG